MVVRRRVGVAAFAVLCLLSGAAGARAPGAGGKRVTVMSRNLYVGGDFAAATAAVISGNVGAVLTEVGALWADVQATDFPTRARALAREVKQAKPDLIGLQEVSLWRIGAGFDPSPATAVVYDYLAILLDAMRREGLQYEVAVVSAGFDAEFPGLTPAGVRDLRVTDREVVLVRKEAGLKISSPVEGHFLHIVSFVTPLGPVETRRGYAAVDVVTGNSSFRFISTHLDPDVPLVRLLQAQEVLEACGPAPQVIVVGDFNSDGNGGASGAVHSFFLSHGFADAWTLTNPSDPGITCYHDALLVDPVPFSGQGTGERIDFVLTRGDVTALAAERFGEDPADRVGGLWPSDHAGVSALLGVGR